MARLARHDELRAQADLSRPLTVDSPAGDDAADDEWQRESAHYSAQAASVALTPDQQARARRVLSDRGQVGAYARRSYAAARARLCWSPSTQTISVHGTFFTYREGALL